MGSNALAFKEWAVNEGITASGPIEQLRNRTVGIDAEDYLQSLLTAGNREPLLPALGGLPFTLKTRVDQDLDAFAEAEVVPVFVFNGLDLACHDTASVLTESRKASTTLTDAWNIYDQGKGEEAVSMFSKACSYRIQQIVRSLKTHLYQKGAKTHTAPYSAAAQLVQFEREEFIDAIVGSASCLVFGAERVIINLDWEAKSFVWVALTKSLPSLALSRDQFINMCLLSGTSILSCMPDLDLELPIAQVQAARAMVTRVGNDVFSLFHESKDDSYRTLFQKAQFSIRYPVVTVADGQVEPLNWQSGPSDAHEFIGQRLPVELYLYLARGIAGPRVLNWRTKMQILETPPLDGGVSQTYKDVVQEKLRPLRVQSLALLTQSLNRYYQKSDVDVACWWSSGAKTPLGLPDATEPTKAAKAVLVKSESAKQNSDASQGSSTLWDIIKSSSTEEKDTLTVLSRSAGPESKLRAVQDIRINTTSRFLMDRDYIGSDRKLSAWGRALNTAFARAISDGAEPTSSQWSEIEEAIFMAFELLRLDVLNGQNMFPATTYSGAPMRGSDTDKAHALLISRIASLRTFKHHTIGYTGPLSRHLLAYHQLAASVRGSLRDLVEMHACNLFLSGSVARDLPNAEYNALGASLPFGEEPDLGLALVVKSYLDEMAQAPSKRQDISKWFNHALDIPGDLEKTFELWDAINAGLQAGDDSIVNADVKKAFRNTDEWLAQKRKQGETSNATT